MIDNRAMEKTEIGFCWRITGAMGDSSCERLKELVHCRNCPVYADAARSLFQRPVPAGSAVEYSEEISRPRHGAPPAGKSVLVFGMSDGLFALPALDLSCVLEPIKVRRVPHMSALISGLVLHEGTLRLCVLLDRILRPDHRPSVGQKMILVDGEASWIFPVDEVISFKFLADSELRPPPATADERFFAGFFSGDGRDVMLLDLRSIGKALAEATGLGLFAKDAGSGGGR